MPGRKPNFPNVVPMRPDAGAGATVPRERQMVREARRLARRLMPKGLDDRLQREWLHWGALLAHPTLNRLKPHYCFAVLELCKTAALIDHIDGALAEANKAARSSSPIASRFYQLAGGRNGEQIKTHPLIPQRNEAVRQLWHWMGEFGLTPAADIRLERLLTDPVQGTLFNDEEDPRNAVAKYIR